MSAKIFKEIKDTIKTRNPDFLTFHDVEQVDYDHAIQGLQHPTNCLEHLHWFSGDKYLKVIMPSALHECPGQWIIDEITDAMVRGIIPPVWVRKIGICASLEYKIFTGEYKRYTKEADLTIIPCLSPDWTKEASGPLWYLRVDGPNRYNNSIVMLLSGWQDPAVRRQNRIGTRMWIKRARPTHPNSFKTSTETYEILPPAVDPVENPSLTFEEFFAGGCPPGLDPKGYVILNLENLRILARRKIINRGNVPDE
ncbi:hypothetical protein C7212DRAFT_347061 [Tuber magnatum]|uniref:Uncharacterized protein n=1 Tax=Tuber magnatum TaxID=42249 RepID=A0A317SGL8_9PEZI|nr:hypothetical protein C7212DRAFT_347061 [Tuber magnatum]